MSEPWPIDPRLIDTVLRSYRRLLIGNLSCRAAERPGFSGAIVLRIEIAASSFCLRGWPRGVDNEARILALHEFLAYVGSQGISYLAVPVASDDGHTLVHAEGRFWQLEPWLPGSADFWSRPSDVRLAAAFRALAHLHQVAAEFRPASGNSSHLAPAAPAIAPAARDRLELINRWTPSRLAELRKRPGRAFGVSEPTFADIAGRIATAFERCAPSVTRELRAAAQERVPLQPCLRDVWHDHVLFERNAVTGLIDPSAARTDTVATDLSRLAGSLIADDRRAWEIALDAYCSIRPLLPAERRLVGVLDHSGVLLSGMGWLERPRAFDQSAEFQSRVLERLQRIAARAEALARSIE
jgi:Ser/Thr protein kinase RdoA (MazF antagonist)